MVEQLLHFGTATGNLSSFCLEPILALHDLFSKFNFYTCEYKSLILEYKSLILKYRGKNKAVVT